MRILITILLSQILFVANVLANRFSIQGKIIGAETFNYAYIYDDEWERIGSVQIVDHSFSFEGEIQLNQRFGELPSAKILLSKTPLTVDEVTTKRLLSNRRHDQCTVILENNINLLYDADKKVFTVKGGKLNQAQNLFEQEYCNYRNKRDSTYLSIDKQNLSDVDKGALKLLQAKRLFTKTMHRFISIIKQYPDLETGLFNFPPVIYDQGITGEEVMDAFNLFSTELKESKYGIHLLKDIEDKINAEELMEKPAYTAGMKMPQFFLPNEVAEKVNAETKYGKYTLIDFWATWCMPCRQETPNVIKAFQVYHQKGFNVITVSIDSEKDKQKWIEVLKNDKMGGFVNLFNGNDASGLARELKIVSIPSNFLVDANGKIVATNLRGDMLEKKLQELMQQ